MEISVFLFVSIVPSSLIDYHWEEFGFWFWLPNIWYFHTFMRFFLHFLLFGLSSDDSSVAFVMKDVPVTQSSLWFFCWPCSSLSMSFLLGRPELDTELWWGVTSGERVSPVVRGRITPLYLLSTLLLSDCRMLLAFFITSVPRLLMFSFLPIKNTRTFSELSNWLALACACALGYSSVGSEPHACLC